MVGITHRSYNELCQCTSKRLIRMPAPYLLRQLHHVKQFSLEILFGSQRVQSLLCRPFQVDRDAVRQLHDAIELIIFYPWHDLEGKIATIAIAVANDLPRVNNLVFRSHPSFTTAHCQHHPPSLPTTSHPTQPPS